MIRLYHRKQQHQAVYAENCGDPERVNENEGYKTHQDSEQRKSEGICCQGRLRRMSGILPVSLQDLLYGC